MAGAMRIRKSFGTTIIFRFSGQPRWQDTLKKYQSRRRPAIYEDRTFPPLAATTCAVIRLALVAFNDTRLFSCRTRFNAT